MPLAKPARAAKPAWRESFESIGGAIVVALLLRAFVLEAFKIPSGSMIPSLAIGDQIFVNKLVFGVRIPFTTTRLIDFQLPERGDVLVFVCPEAPHEDYIKRVVGLPGDRIEVRDGVINLNGKELIHTPLGHATFWDRDSQHNNWQSFTAQTYHEELGKHQFTVLQDLHKYRQARDFGPYVVPAGHVWMMGDNRDHSYDSRAWGPVPLDHILGRSLFVWWSWGDHGLNVARLGKWIP